MQNAVAKKSHSEKTHLVSAKKPKTTTSTASLRSDQVRVYNTETLMDNETLAKSATSAVSVKDITIDIGQTLVSISAIIAYFKDHMTHPEKPTFRRQREESFTISCGAPCFNRTSIRKFFFRFLQRNKKHKVIKIKSNELGFVLCHHTVR